MRTLMPLKRRWSPRSASQQLLGLVSRSESWEGGGIIRCLRVAEGVNRERICAHHHILRLQRLAAVHNPFLFVQLRPMLILVESLQDRPTGHFAPLFLVAAPLVSLHCISCSSWCCCLQNPSNAVDAEACVTLPKSSNTGAEYTNIEYRQGGGVARAVAADRRASAPVC